MNDRLPGLGDPSGRAAAGTTSAAADADKYHQMLALADLFDTSGEEMRTRARLGTTILQDDDVVSSAALSPATVGQAEEDIRAATTGKHGLLSRSVELDADALVVRATVLTYRWIDELQQAAYQTLGSIAGRAIGYLAPEVALGGAIVSAGLIETDTLDRDGVAAYLSDLAENNPELMDHISSGGGLLDGLQMRSLLTAGVLSGDQGALAARGGLRAVGVQPFGLDAASALRDSIGAFVTEAEAPDVEVTAEPGDQPRDLTTLMQHLARVEADPESSVVVHEVGPGRHIAYLRSPAAVQPATGSVRLISGDHSIYARRVVKAIEKSVVASGDGSPGDGSEPPHVMLVGGGQGGGTAAGIAAETRSSRFVVDQVVAVAAPSAQVPIIPESCRVLSLEDRSDPVALLGSLINQSVVNRLTVVFDGSGVEGGEAYVAAGRAADASGHPALVAELERLRELGYLAP